jgi:hypothetical protein
VVRQAVVRAATIIKVALVDIVFRLLGWRRGLRRTGRKKRVIAAARQDIGPIFS